MAVIAEMVPLVKVEPIFVIMDLRLKATPSGAVGFSERLSRKDSSRNFQKQDYLRTDLPCCLHKSHKVYDPLGIPKNGDDRPRASNAKSRTQRLDEDFLDRFCGSLSVIPGVAFHPQ